MNGKRLLASLKNDYEKVKPVSRTEAGMEAVPYSTWLYEWGYYLLKEAQKQELREVKEKEK